MDTNGNTPEYRRPSDAAPEARPAAQQAAPAAPRPPAVQPGPAPAASSPIAPPPAAPFFADGERHHVHSSYVWISSLGGVFGMLLVILSIIPGILGEISNARAAGIVVLVILVSYLVLAGLVVGISALSWRFLTFSFGPGEFNLHSGVITKRRDHVPYGRVQSVNHRASIIQRVFGLCSVSIETAGGAANKAIKVPYVKLDVAENIRRDLFLRKALVERGPADAGGATGNGAAVAAAGAGSPATSAAVSANVLDEAFGTVGEWRGAWGGREAEMEPVSYRTGLSNRELLLTAISHEKTAILTGILSLTMLVMLCALGVASFLVLPAAIASGVAGLIAGTLIIALSYGGFSARRRGRRIEVERGLLQREFSGIDVERIQSVNVRQGFLRRCMGYCEISVGRIDSADAGKNGQANSPSLERHGLVIHPFIRLDRVDGVLAGLLPEFDDRPGRPDEVRVAPVALRRAIIRRCVWQNGALWAGIACALMQAALHLEFSGSLAGAGYRYYPDLLGNLDVACGIVYLVCLCCTAAFAASAVIWHRGSGFSCNRRFLSVFNDGLRTNRTVVPRSKVQCGSTRRNPLQALAHVATIDAVTAAGVGSTSIRLRDVADEDADAYLDWITPRR